jgi:hypothetical protein
MGLQGSFEISFGAAFSRVSISFKGLAEFVNGFTPKALRHLVHADTQFP